MNRFYVGQSVKNLAGLFGRILRIAHLQHRNGTPFIEYLIGIEDFDNNIVSLDYWLTNEMIPLEL